MNVVISAGGRFHALHLAHQLQKRNALKKLFTFDYTVRDLSYVNSAHVHQIGFCKFINDVFVKLRLARFIDKAWFNNTKDNFFDRCVCSKISHVGPIDIFVGWAHYALHSISAARASGAKIIIESGSSHILEQQNILSEEYSLWGLKSPPILPATIEKMCMEYGQADYVMTLSSFARKSFVKHGIIESKLLTIPCGVDVDFFMRHYRRPVAKKFRVIFVGMVSLRKGVQYLIQAWSSLQLPLHMTELVIVGPLQKDFMAIRSLLNVSVNIKFIGPTDRATLKTLYEQASVFVLPSLEDGFGMVIGEAMATGLPIICTSSTAGAELIEQYKHGFIVEPRNVDALSEKILWCYENRLEALEIGQNACERIRSFSWNIYGERVYNAYSLICST